MLQHGPHIAGCCSCPSTRTSVTVHQVHSAVLKPTAAAAVAAAAGPAAAAFCTIQHLEQKIIVIAASIQQINRAPRRAVASWLPPLLAVLHNWHVPPIGPVPTRHLASRSARPHVVHAEHRPYYWQLAAQSLPRQEVWTHRGQKYSALSWKVCEREPGRHLPASSAVLKT